MDDPLLEKLSRTPETPGVYLMKDAAGHVIYVGKAQHLKKRLSSYFKKNGPPDLKTGVLIKKIRTFDTIITTTEKEALILESTLIKRYKPRYNVILKDDKRYPSLRLDTRHPYPNLTIVRKTPADGTLYFGPFTSALAVRQTLAIINKTFKLRKCKQTLFSRRTRPCLNFQIGTCLAPCCLKVDRKDYDEIVKEVTLFLKGRTPELIGKVKRDMQMAAEAQEFERAAALRDKMFALEKTLEKQVAVTTDFIDRDVLAVAGTDCSRLLTLLAVRGGHLQGTRHFHFSETWSNEAEILGAFIRQYYNPDRFVPKEILLPARPEDAPLIESWLSGLKGQSVTIRVPQRGQKVRLLEMARQNARKEQDDRLAAAQGRQELLERLARRLNLKRIPRRIECFDNSNISGRNAVAGMVVFADGKPDKRSYRKYTITGINSPDDYACMSQALQRRYGRNSSALELPDLLLVDGGKGQLNIAVAVLGELKLTGRFDVVAIAKKDEKRKETLDKIFTPGRVNPINFGREGDLLLFLQRIRDEAHRFAVSFHRRRRAGNAVQSLLDTVPGIGRVRKKNLLRHFKSIKKIRAASLEEISELPGMNTKVAEALREALRRSELLDEVL